MHAYMCIYIYIYIYICMHICTHTYTVWTWVLATPFYREQLARSKLPAMLARPSARSRLRQGAEVHSVPPRILPPLTPHPPICDLLSGPRKR